MSETSFVSNLFLPKPEEIITCFPFKLYLVFLRNLRSKSSFKISENSGIRIVNQPPLSIRVSKAELQRSRHELYEQAAHNTRCDLSCHVGSRRMHQHHIARTFLLRHFLHHACRHGKGRNSSREVLLPIGAAGPQPQRPACNATGRSLLCTDNFFHAL